MGLTFNLGRVSPSVFTDSSLNVGIGGSPSGSYKLEVTGTAKVSGVTNITSATASTSTTTGALVVTGGFGIGGALFGTSAVFNHNDAPTIKVQRSGGTDTNTALEFTNASRSFFIGSNGTVMGLGGTSGSIAAQPLQITSTGAATFSSSVTSTQLKAESSLNGDPELATFTNSNAGTGTEATIYVRNSSSNNDGTFIQALGTAFTTTGGFVQDGGVIGTGTGLSGGLSLMVRANADMRFYTNGHTNERMRITSGGQVNINSAQTTYPFYVQAALGNWTAVFENTANGGSGILMRSTGGSQGYYYGAYDGGAYKFFINGSGVVNSTSQSITLISSDAKLKTDIRDYDKGLAEVLAMKPRIYKRKNNLAVDEVGFIAQEMDIALAGSMIESYKDEEGEPIHTYQLEWYPLLVKAIQEMNEKITLLEQAK